MPVVTVELQESAPRTLAADHANRRLVRFQRGCHGRAMIGSKILSGRTKDQNVGYIAEYLTALGIDLKEVGGWRMRSGVAAPMSSPPAGSARPW
jgi:hypothetical protein